MQRKFYINKFKYAIVILSVFLVSFLGGLLTDIGMDWYNTLSLPEFTPPGSIIGIIWSIIFVLVTIAIISFLRKNKGEKELYFNLILFLLILNGILNILWSALFFVGELFLWSIIEMCFLNLVNLALIILLWKKNKFASILFWPYFLWICLATYFAYSIWLLN